MIASLGIHVSPASIEGWVRQNFPVRTCYSRVPRLLALFCASVEIKLRVYKLNAVNFSERNFVNQAFAERNTRYRRVFRSSRVIMFTFIAVNDDHDDGDDEGEER